jgi:hypothetical protein
VAVVALLAVGAVVVLGDDGDDPAASDDTTEDRPDSTETVDILTEPSTSPAPSSLRSGRATARR